MIQIFRWMMKSIRLVADCRMTLRYFLCTLVFALLPLGNLASAQLSSFEAGNLKFSLDQKESNVFSVSLYPKGGIQSLTQDLTANVFAISGPSRLVIDVPGFSSGGENKEEFSHPLLSRVRVGNHPEKIRFVIDIANEAKPTYTVRTDIDTESIIVDFTIIEGETATAGYEINSQLKKPLTTAAKTPPKTSPADRPEATQTTRKVTTPPKTDSTVKDADALLLQAIRAAQASKGSVSKEPVITEPVSKDDSTNSLPTQVTKSITDSQPNPASLATTSNPATVTTPSNSQATVVSAIEFKQWPADSAGAVVIEVSNPGSYQLIPQGEDRYELRLANAQLGASHLVIPQFPPETFKEFDVIMARQTGSSVVIQVYITKGVKLYPAKVENSIWLKTSE